MMLNDAQFARTFHYSPRFRTLYVNNPKVACSSIKLTLQRAELDDPSYTPSTSVHDHSASPLKTFRNFSADQALGDALFTFSFVRNPYERLISGYLNKIVVPQNKGKFRESAGFDKDECPSFDDFVQSVCKQDPVEMNPHWRVQAVNLSFGRITYDFIGRMESFDAEWGKVALQTGLPVKPSFAGARTHLWSAQRPAYSFAAVKAVRIAYARDFEIFGYDPAAIVTKQL